MYHLYVVVWLNRQKELQELQNIKNEILNKPVKTNRSIKKDYSDDIKRFLLIM